MLVAVLLAFNPALVSPTLFDPTILSAQSPDPFAFLAPTIRISAFDRQRVDRGETVVRVLPPHNSDIAMVAVTLTSMTPERLVAWARDVERLKSAPPVHRVRRLSKHPTLDEFAELALPERDIRDIRNCRLGSCELKLTEAELARIRREMQVAGAHWVPRGAAVFREIARDRVIDYLAGGHAALEPYADGRGAPSRDASFAAVLASTDFLRNAPDFLTLLSRPTARPDVESFTYWSIEDFGMKKVASATETIITTSSDPARPAVLIAGKQIFATHYANASLNLTALLRRPGTDPLYYLVIVNRSTIDSVEGFFGGLVRRAIEGRVRRETGDLITSLRMRIEAGPPRT